MSRKYSFKKLSQFSPGNNALVAPATNIAGLLWRDVCVSTRFMNIPIHNKPSLSPPWNVGLAGSIPFKNYHISHRGNNVLDAAASNIDGFHWRDTCVFSIQLRRPFWSKEGITPSWNLCLQEEFLSKTKSLLTGKECVRYSCFKHRWFSLERYMSFFNSAEKACFDQADSISTLKTMICRRTSFKTNSILTEKQCTRYLASNSDDFP
jgi:hypothetical protein